MEMNDIFNAFLLKAILIMLTAMAASFCQANCTRHINVHLTASPPLSTKNNADSTATNFDSIFLRGIEEKTGCTFTYIAAPKSRQEALFRSGQFDLLHSATRTKEREKYGIFIPQLQIRATIISLDSARKGIDSAKDLLDRTELHLVLLRGSDYGPAYLQLVEELNKQGRVSMEADANSVARTLRLNSNYVTIMSPVIFITALQKETRKEFLVSKVRYENIDALPWIDSGIYVSKNSLNKQDQVTLVQAFTSAAKNGEIWNAFLRVFPQEEIRKNIRQISVGSL